MSSLMSSLNQIRLTEQIPFDNFLSLEVMIKFISLRVQMQDSMTNKL